MSAAALGNDPATTRTPARKRAAATPAPKDAPTPDVGHAESAVEKRTPAAAQINFRADAETKAALEELTADGTPISVVIRNAIKGARRAARRAQAVAEMEAIMSDPTQRAISEQVYRDMSNLSAW